MADLKFGPYADATPLELEGDAFEERDLDGLSDEIFTSREGRDYFKRMAVEAQRRRVTGDRDFDVVTGPGYKVDEPGWLREEIDAAFERVNDHQVANKQAEFDPVTRPSHYNQHGIEAIDAIQASMEPLEFRGYLKGNALKYIWRYRYKGKALEDLRKARWYLDRLISEVEKENV